MKHFCWILLFTLFVIAPVTSPILADDDAVAKTFATTPDGSYLYIYRKSNVWGLAIPFQAFVDGNSIGAIANKKYRVIKLPPGEHVIYVLAYESQKSLTIETRAGRNYYVKVTSKIGLVSPRASIKKVSEKKAQKDILKLNPSKTFSLDQGHSPDS